jgi:hypothetical protein
MMWIAHAIAWASSAAAASLGTYLTDRDRRRGDRAARGGPVTDRGLRVPDGWTLEPPQAALKETK